ncbi:plasmid replication initiator TrfA [Pseudomonas veronii]
MARRVNAILAEHNERISAKRNDESNHIEVQPTVEYGSLPNWSDSVRRVPNVALRSALFGTMKPGARHYVEQLEISSLGDASVLYTGVLLDQGDLDVWEAVLHCSRTQEWGAECRVTAYRLLKFLGRTDTGPNRTILDLSISRLKATALNIRLARISYEGSLIHEVYRAHGEQSKRIYAIRLNPQLRVLFSDDQFTDVDWSIRRALRGKPLAQWIHGFYASHARPYDLKVETLHRLCGSTAICLGDFRKDLRRALEAVRKESANFGRPFSYLFKDHLVQVETTPSASQKRHLAKKR